MTTFEELESRFQLIFDDVEDILETLSGLTSYKQLATAQACFYSLNEAKSKLEAWEVELDLFKRVNPTVSVNTLTSMRKDMLSKILIGRAKVIFLENEKADQDATTKQSPLQSSSASQSVQNSSTPKSMLSSDHVPVFSGRLTDYQQFITLYNECVHSNTSMSKIQKFVILKNKLKDNALTAISHLSLTEPNYDIAYDLIVKQYSNPRVCASFYLKALIDFNKPKTFSATQFLEFHRNTIQNFRELSFTNAADFMLFFMMYRNLPDHIRMNFDKTCNKNEPVPQDIFDFLSDAIRSELITKSLNEMNNSTVPTTLSGPQTNKNSTHQPTAFSQKTNSYNWRSPPTQVQSQNTVLVASPSHICMCCHKDDHFRLHLCPVFLKWDYDQRSNFVYKERLCIKCLKSTHHTASECHNPVNCHHCQFPHHSLLCRKKLNTSPKFQRRSNAPSGQQPSSNQHKASPNLAPHSFNNNQANLSTLSTQPTTSDNTLISATSESGILGTLRLCIRHNSQVHRVNCILDSGSMVEMVNSNVLSRLGIPVEPISSNKSVNGLGGHPSKLHGRTTLTLWDENGSESGPHITIHPLVVDKIMDPADISIEPDVVAQCQQYRLADTEFQIGKMIHILLGVNCFTQIVNFNSPPIRKPLFMLPTVFGHVVMGSQPTTDLHSNISNFDASTNEDISNADLNKALSKFWDIDTLPAETNSTTSERSLAEEIAEQHYVSTTYKLDDGSFVLSYPFKSDPPNLSNNKAQAVSLFLNQEKRLLKDPFLKRKYDDVFKNYLLADYMYPSSFDSGYFLPHHAVIKPAPSGDPADSKLRIVLNGSKRYQGQPSLNDSMYVGPALQQDITSIILNSRFAKVFSSTDVSQMFLQFHVDPTQHQYTQLVWRASPKQPIKSYVLSRLVFGLSASPYLAIRTLQQLAKENLNEFPIAANIINNFSYVNDLFLCFSSVQESLKAKIELESLFSKANLQLKKWSSTSEEFLSQIDPSDQDTNIFSGNETFSKVLGLKHNKTLDTYGFSIDVWSNKVTKRNVLSYIAKIYDVCSFLGPVVVTAKLFIQKLWMESVPWDTELDSSLSNEWIQFCASLQHVQSLQIPRFILSSYIRLRLLVFGDASTKAYGAVAYVSMEHPDGGHSTQLLQAKSRVAPVKTMSMPRLELLACVLTSELCNHVTNQIKLIQFNEILLLTDSQIALFWIHSDPDSLKAFVGNRVKKIQEATSHASWYYVNTTSNSADILSRGCQATDLISNHAWWHGPEFLSRPRNEWQFLSTQDLSPLTDNSESKPQITTALLTNTTTATNQLYNHITTFSSYAKKVRIMAYVLRFIDKCKSQSNKPNSKHVTFSEYTNAEYHLFKLSQQEHLPDVLHAVKNKNNHRLMTFNPFFDDFPLLRVEGRLKNANLQYEFKHPIIVSSKCPIVLSYIQHIHLVNLHVGISTLKALCRRKLYIINLNSAVRKVVHQCLPCIRASSRAVQPLMASLPEGRVAQHVKPFTHCGVDFFGPVEIKVNTLRSSSLTKAWGCIFTCLGTRAVHIELCSSLSMAAFQACLDRFIARRGRIKCMYSDNGSNFCAAAKDYNDIFEFLKNNETLLGTYASKLQFDWIFNPPVAPNFGGVWEICVKLTKDILVRNIKNKKLTFEEYYTVLTQVESIINSRPLIPFTSSDDNSILLTPAHFLLTEPSIVMPYLPVSDKEALKTRWALVRQTIQAFWHQWSSLYLNSLIQRQKWQKKCDNIKVDQLVFIKENDSHPGLWPIGVVQETYLGKDNTVRAAAVKFNSKVYVRPVNRLILIPDYEF